MRSGPDAPLADASYAALFGVPSAETLGDLWRTLVERSFEGPPELGAALEVILAEGTLAQRILRALGPGFGRPELRRVYGELCDCLAEGRSFRA